MVRQRRGLGGGGGGGGGDVITLRPDRVSRASNQITPQ